MDVVRSYGFLGAEASQIDVFYLSDFEQFDVGSADKSQKQYDKTFCHVPTKTRSMDGDMFFPFCSLQ
jgi:hypothetical protein